MKEAELTEMLRARLGPSRFQHSLQVASAAAELAAHCGENTEDAYIAGLLHDFARDLSGEELLAIAGVHGLIQDPIEAQIPDLLHGPVAAWLLREQGIIRDETILSAIANHTVGDPLMGTLDKIIYVADLIEPGRDYEGVEELREWAGRSLDHTMILSIEQTARYCMQRGRLIHPRSIILRNQLLTALTASEPVLE